MAKAFYITTPIYYVTDAPHIGHLYTTVAADITARYERMRGSDVWFLTGTDEHGQKIEKKAKELGETPKALSDRVVERYRDAWKVYDIRYDDFIRTSEARHAKVVKAYIKQLMDKGDIYLDSYEGWYCVPDESYWAESQILEGNKCPDCGRPLERLKEESYFFKMSAYVKPLLDHIEKNPGFIQPESRKNEVLGFLRQEVRDISISRTTIQWGIEMPPDAKATKQHKVYVWFDALTNYLSALGPLDEDKSKYEKYWKSAIHFVGKDILRFHAVYWPTFLMALGLPVPKKIVVHGWLTDSNRKISKSLGNAIDPIALASEVGVDGMRYFLFREFVFGLDGEYTKEIMYTRINADLANDYGNCVTRVCSMIQKYLGDAALHPRSSVGATSDLKSVVEQSVPAFHEAMENFRFEKALEANWKIVGATNRYIENSAPWALAKSGTPEDKKKLEIVLMECHEALRVVTILAMPFIPSTCQKALGFLGVPEPKSIDVGAWGKGPDQVHVAKPSPLFPRLELKKEEPKKEPAKK